MSKINPDQIGTKTKPIEKNTTPSKVEKIIGEPKVPQEVSSQQSSKQSSNEGLGDSSYGRTQNRMYSNDVLSREQNTEPVVGILDIQPEGHGFLRPKFIPSSRDIYISQSQIRRFLLRPGDLVTGIARPPKDTERYYGLLKVETINGLAADASIKRPHFDELIPIYPKKQIILATGKMPLSTRIMDLVS